LEGVDEVEQLDTMFADAPDAQVRSMVVCRALEVDVVAGVRMAIDYLGSDPPLLFRMTVVDKLAEIIGRAIDYDINQPFDSPSNRAVLDSLEQTLGRSP
jgi:hypothetical protein